MFIPKLVLELNRTDVNVMLKQCFFFLFFFFFSNSTVMFVVCMSYTYILACLYEELAIVAKPGRPRYIDSPLE